MEQRCLFCGEPLGPEHDTARCDGRQGWAEAAKPLPRLISGLSAATYATSEAAADSVEDSRDTQRARVLAAIRAMGRVGATDDELQILLALDGSSERPRRWELWKRDAICVLRTPEGAAVRRLTRTNRQAVVWVTPEFASVPEEAPT